MPVSSIAMLALGVAAGCALVDLALQCLALQLQALRHVAGACVLGQRLGRATTLAAVGRALARLVELAAQRVVELEAVYAGVGLIAVAAHVGVQPLAP